jgi:hypothetical protein
MTYKNFSEADLPGLALSEEGAMAYEALLADALALPWGADASVVEATSHPRAEIRPMLSETHIIVREFQVVTPLEPTNNHLVTMLPGDAATFSKQDGVIKKAALKAGLSVYWAHVRIENRLIDQAAMRCLVADVWVWKSAPLSVPPVPNPIEEG